MAELTDAMVEAAGDAWRTHDTRTRELDDHRWIWFCECGADNHDAPLVDDDDAELAGRHHEWRTILEAALDAAMVREASPAPGDLLDARPMWACTECFARYSLEVGDLDDTCACGETLQPVTLQLVARQA